MIFLSVIGSVTYTLLAVATFRSSNKQFVREFGEPKHGAALIGAVLWPMLAVAIGISHGMFDCKTSGWKRGHSAD